jgi:hypothetical protein
MQNLHPGMEKVDVRVSLVPRPKPSAPASGHLLWNGTIPHNADPMHIYSRNIPLSVPGVSQGLDCCLRIELQYRGETFSDGNGSWKSGRSFQRIKIQSQNGAFYVQNEGPDEPEDFDKYKVEEVQ